MLFSKVFRRNKNFEQKIIGIEVRTSIAILILLVQVLPCIGSGASARSLEGPACLLPWRMIAEKTNEGNKFCSNIGSEDGSNVEESGDAAGILSPNANYVFRRNQPLCIKLPEEITAAGSVQEIRVSAVKCVENSWHAIGKVIASIEDNGLKVTDGIEEEGFFRLYVTVGTQHKCQHYFEVYGIVSENWKKDILAFCRKLKSEIELGPDAELIRSSIAISHVDHTMEMVSRSSFLSWEILSGLADAVDSKKAFDRGECPDFVRGLNKIRVKRFEGGQTAEFVIHVPDEYSSSKKWPVHINVDPWHFCVGKYGDESQGEGCGYREGMIDLWWHTTSHKDRQWEEYLFLLEMLKEKLNIDEERIYLYGFCGNGAAAMSLALHYPDQWAECTVLTGNSFRHLAGNALNLNFLFGNAHLDVDALRPYVDFAVKCFEFFGCQHFKYGNSADIAQIRGAPLPEANRGRSPQRVLYTIESLDNPSAYWVKIVGREDENLIGTVDASVDGQTIFVKTRNVDAYSLELARAPIDANKPVEIIENGQSLGLVTDKIFTRRTGKYANVAHIKNEHLHGPVWDAFTDPYVVVWGAGSEDKEFCKASEKIARSLAGSGPYCADVDVQAGLADSHNLVLIGTAETNCRLAKVAGKLPVQIINGHIRANGRTYEGDDTGFFLIYPNPLNPDKYVAVFSATSVKAMSDIEKAYFKVKSMKPADVAIYEITKNGDIKWQIIEKFNTVWGWHDQWRQELARTKREHPKWRWCQWIAKALRAQLESDVVIYKDPFRFSDLTFSGRFTYRDLFNTLRNDWIVKIELDGESLREFLSVLIKDVSKKEVAALIIDGVSFVKGSGDYGWATLGINELESYRKYTVALPYRAINSGRMGIGSKNYKIAGEGYLVPLLKDYFCKNKSIDIDAELNGLKLNVF